MLDHHNICWSIDSVHGIFDFDPRGSRIVSYLPMAHVAERLISHYCGIAFGYEVTTCADIRGLGAALADTHPHLLFGVPRTFVQSAQLEQPLVRNTRRTKTSLE